MVKLLPALLAAASLYAQTPARPEFEVASIKPSPPLFARANIGVHIDGALVSCTFFSLRDYIGMAYRVKAYQISAPEWVASTRFDIHAKLPAGGRDQVPEMLRALLDDRFKLQMHHDSRQFPVYALVVAKGGAKMKESPPDPDTPSAPDAGPKNAVNVTASGGREGTSVNLGHGSYFTFANNRFEARKLSMPSMAEMLARFVDRPIVDMTELQGNYDFTLEVTPEDFRAMMVRAAIAAGVSLPPEAMRALDTTSGDSLGAALQLLGLKLEARKAPMDVLVVDHMEKSPTEN